VLACIMVRVRVDSVPTLIRGKQAFLHFFANEFVHSCVPRSHHIFASSFSLQMNCATLVLQVELYQNAAAMSILAYFDLVFLGVFVLEAVAKIVACGFVATGPNAYLRDSWIAFDFAIVVVGLVAATGASGNFTFVRTLRVLRPLKAISGVDGLRVMVVSLLRSMPQLLNVLALLLFLLAVFALVGMQLFDGQFRQRCVVAATGQLLVTQSKVGALNASIFGALPSSMSSSISSVVGGSADVSLCARNPSLTFLGSHGTTCPAGSFCAGIVCVVFLYPAALL
jgi:hypothetical protein